MNKEQFKSFYNKLISSYVFDDYVLFMDKKQKRDFFEFINSKQKKDNKMIADFLIENCFACKYYEIENQKDKKLLAILNSYKNKINLESIKSEIKYKFGADAKVIYLNWSNPRGQTMDQIAMELTSYGIYLSSLNVADIFFEFLQKHQDASKVPSIKKHLLMSIMTGQHLQDFRKHIFKMIEDNSRQKEC